MKGDVFRNRLFGKNGKILIDDVDAQLPGLGGRQFAEGLTLPDDLASVRGLCSDDAFHQGGLAGTIGAGKAQDLSGANVQVNLVQRLSADIALAQALESQKLHFERSSQQCLEPDVQSPA